MIHAGIPEIDEYHQLLNQGIFKKMEVFSDAFLEKNREILCDYSKKWGSDPLHGWSRQWEYPYVYSVMKKVFEKNKENSIKILDAGSGVTFFPQYIMTNHQNASMFCCDYDPLTENTIKKINDNTEHKVCFTRTRIQETDYEKDHFDIVYSVSVLEHTKNYSDVVNELYRIIKPGGKLIITFDISKDGTRDISINKADELLKTLSGRFKADDNYYPDLGNRVRADNTFTTLCLGNENRAQLPWKRPPILYKLYYLLKGRGLIEWPPPLTVYCLSLTK